MKTLFACICFLTKHSCFVSIIRLIGVYAVRSTCMLSVCRSAYFDVSMSIVRCTLKHLGIQATKFHARCTTEKQQTRHKTTDFTWNLSHFLIFRMKMEYYDEVVEIKNKPKRIPSQKSTDLSAVSNEVTPLEHKIPEPNAVTSIDDAERTTQKRPASSLPRNAIQKIERISSESESSDSDTEDNVKHSAEGFDYKQWENLNVSSEIKELFQYIPR